MIRGYRFADFELDVRSGEIRRKGLLVRLQEQPLQVLRVLLERPGEVVPREELQRRLWPSDTLLDSERGLNNALRRLRDALLDAAASPRLVETLGRQGYRFVARVEPIESAPAAQQASHAAPAPTARRARPWVLAAALVASAAVAGALVVRGRAREPPPGRLMLAVLPFENLSGDPEQEYFSDGLTEEMIAQLSMVQPESMRVIARTSAMQYKDTRKTAGQIGRELRVDYLLEG